MIHTNKQLDHVNMVPACKYTVYTICTHMFLKYEYEFNVDVGEFLQS